MKIFIGTTDICGLLPIYKKGFELNGHLASTGVFSALGNPYYSNQYDYYLKKAKSSGQKYFLGSLGKLFIRGANYLTKRFINKSHYSIIDRIIEKHDVFVFLWSGFKNDGYDYELLKSKNKKIVSVFVGSDIRYFKAFRQKYNVDDWEFPDEFANESVDRVIKKIRLAEKYSDVILSVPDQSIMGLRPYHHFQIPLDLDQFKFNIPSRDIPKVIHAPSRPWLKGTDKIESTLKRLESEGVKFEFISIRDIKNVEVRKVLTDADVVIDEIVLHGPGVLSFEAMASGCAVATRYLEDSPVCFRPPIVNINASNIYDKLKLLLVDKSLRIELAENSRKYVEANNSTKKITADIVNKLNINQSDAFDYFPCFLRNEYFTENEAEIRTINLWTDFLKSCSWYDRFVARGERAGLLF